MLRELHVLKCQDPKIHLFLHIYYNNVFRSNSIVYLYGVSNNHIHVFNTGFTETPNLAANLFVLDMS